MKYTMKVYKNSDDHAAYLKARSGSARNGQSFEWAARVATESRQAVRQAV